MRERSFQKSPSGIGAHPADVHHQLYDTVGPGHNQSGNGDQDFLRLRSHRAAITPAPIRLKLEGSGTVIGTQLAPATNVQRPLTRGCLKEFQPKLLLGSAAFSVIWMSVITEPPVAFSVKKF